MGEIMNIIISTIIFVIYITSVFAVRHICMFSKIGLSLDKIDLMFILTPALNTVIMTSKIIFIVFVYLKGKTEIFIKWQLIYG